jgi:hypothetical protein
MIITKETHSQFPFQNSIEEKLGIATSGTASYTDGQIGRAATNSSTSYNGINVGSNSSYNYLHQTGIGSVSFWIKLNNYAANEFQFIFASTDFASNQTGVVIAYDNRQISSILNLTTREIRIFITRGITGRAIVEINAKNAIMDNNWHHVCFVFDNINNINKCYVDTIEQTDLYFFSNKTSPGGFNATYTPRIMRRPSNNTPRFNVLGSLQHLTFFKKTLNISDIKRVYNGLHPLI